MVTKKKETKPKKDRKATAGMQKRRSTPSERASDPFYIVGIGASAGGLEAFERFFRTMPERSDMAFVLVPHLDPKHVSLMPELIQKTAKMKVIQVTDNTKVEPDTVYVVPPKKKLAIFKGTLQLMDQLGHAEANLPIDHFFRSLADDCGQNAIGIVLSGMGTDGTLGIRALKGKVGMVMAQKPASAKYDSMPRSAINTGLVDFVLPPEEMPAQLITYVDQAQKRPVPRLATTEKKLANDMQKVFFLLRTHTGHDFSLYKKNTVFRRVERRMNVHQIKKIGHYVRFLQENVQEVENLFKELLIGVTSFFRDAPAFQSLEDKALPIMMEGRNKDDPLRAWVPGCSSGEEAYSIAILLRETMEKLKAHFATQVFATDIDQNAIETARTAIYPGSISSDVSRERLTRFFMTENGGYHIKKEIREMLVFAPQDVIKDPPFTNLDLICCRNLLIYLDAELQKKLLPLFHYSLKPGGILFLGSSETIGGYTDLFKPIDKKWKIYRREATISTTRMVVDFPLSPSRESHSLEADREPPEANVVKLVEKDLLRNYAPPSVTINHRGDILYVHGRTGKYLEPAPGEATLNLMVMAREGLKLELPAAIQKATSQNTEVIYRGLKVRDNGGMETVDVTVRPVGSPQDKTGLWMVVFEDVKPRPKEGPKQKPRKSTKATQTRTEELEKELQNTKENLHITIEELETSNEELKSTNEELQSTNEELQSTNEELETSKEEQQSLNEELTTVNSELNGKLEALTTTSNDMKNLMDNIEIPTIFLDNDLSIKRFTTHASKVVSLIPTDVGRPISDIATKFHYVEFVKDAEAVLRDLVFREREVKTKDGLWYLMRILPYRTVDNVIDGVVITFQDISDRKTGERLRQFATVIEDSNDAITLLDFKGNIFAWNRRAAEMYGWSEEEALRMNLMVLTPADHRKEMLAVLKKLKQNKRVETFQTSRINKDGETVKVSLTLSQLVDEKGQPNRIVSTERHIGQG